MKNWFRYICENYTDRVENLCMAVETYISNHYAKCFCTEETKCPECKHRDAITQRIKDIRENSLQEKGEK